MNSEDKFKELLRQKLAAREFSFDPEKWEKTRQMIDASREKKRRRAGFLILSLLLMIVGVISLFVIDNQEDTLIVAKPMPSLEKTALSPEKETDIKPSEIKNTTGSSSHALSTPKEQTLPEQEVKHPQLPVNKTSVPTQKSGSSESKPETKTIGKVRIATQKNLATPESPTIYSAPIVSLATNNHPDAPQTSMPLRTVLQPTVEKTDAPVNDKQEKEELPLAMAAEEKTAVNSKADEVALNKDTLSNLPIVETKTMPSVTKDTLAAVSASVPVIDPDGLLFPKNVFYMEAGANYLLGWKGQSKRDANGFNPILGFGYMNFITKKIALSLGAQYSSVGNLNGYSHTSQVTKMGLGEESSITVITPVKMHQFAGVLKLNFIINPKNMIGLGYTLAYLLAMENKVDTYEQRTNFAPQQHTVSKTNGYAEGFSKFDSQLSVFYRRRIYKNLSLNTEFMFGITDIKNNAFFGSGTFERDLGLKLSLIYNLFKK